VGPVCGGCFHPQGPPRSSERLISRRLCDLRLRARVAGGSHLYRELIEGEA